MTIVQKFLAFILFIFFGWLVWVFVISLQAAGPEITASVIAVIGAVIGGLYTHVQIRKREIKSRHFIEKKNAYMLFINLLLKQYPSSRVNNQLTTVR